MTTLGPIGLASGYQSFSAFVRAFRTIYGKTPGQVRRVVGER